MGMRLNSSTVRHRRLVHRLERYIDIVEATGSTPVSPTKRNNLTW